MQKVLSPQNQALAAMRFLYEKVLHRPKVGLRRDYRCFHPGEWLFFGRDKAKPMPVGSAQKIFYLARNRAGIGHGGIHTLRHCHSSTEASRIN